MKEIYDIWQLKANKLIDKYFAIMNENNFKFSDAVILAKTHYFMHPTIEQERRYKESLNLIDLILKEIDKMPKQYRGYILSRCRRFK